MIVAAVRVGVLTGDGMTTAVPQPDQARSAAGSPTFSDASQPLDTLGAVAGVLEIALADSTPAYATVHWLSSGQGQLTVVHRRAEALAAWRSDTALTVTLSATTGFVVLILGFAFHWQATRAREADGIYETVRTRIDTALNRGRCGLWDWDLGRGRIFWSHSMFAILGLKPKDDLLSFGEVNALVHPEDLHLYELAAQLAEAKASSIDHAFRMRHADGHWVWLRARCELVQQPGRSLAAPDRHRRRHHRAEDAGRTDRRSRPAPARRDRDHPGSVRAVGRQQPPGAVQLQFPGAAQPARRGRQGRNALRRRGRRRAQAGGAHPGDQRGPGARRAHLRGPARGRPLAAHQRAPHQGRRLCVGRHRHHHRQAARREADAIPSSG